jgi:cation diffusion facilitator CzcD-associated flavoprotein CzcO
MGGHKAANDVEHVDVLIVGAGISGIAAAHALSRGPARSFVVIDAMEGHGGTWRLHRYPGVRSDSDLFTYGFHFKPWGGAPIASGGQILDYLGEAIAESGLQSHFRYRMRMKRAEWNSRTSCWHITGVSGPDEAPFALTCNFLWMCQGYYRHAQGFTPEWPGMATFKGRIVHPQTWPDDLDVGGKRVVVVGSGATAATLVPALAGQCAHVTMLQRSPTYFDLRENSDALADTLRTLEIDPAIIHDILRKKITYDQQAYFRHVARHPEKAQRDLLRPLENWLPRAEIERHFTPAYMPWQQRVAVTPSADLFKAFQSGAASIVTDEIDRFTADGLVLKSGQTLAADIVVTATGFEVTTLGDAQFFADGQRVDLSQTHSYRACMFTGLPNLARSVGYLRLSSWTLRADLTAAFVTRLLARMDALGAASVAVELPENPVRYVRKTEGELKPFTATYMLRALHQMPQPGPGPTWQVEDYWTEKDSFPAIDLAQGPFVFRGADGRTIEATPPGVDPAGA